MENLWKILLAFAIAAIIVCASVRLLILECKNSENLVGRNCKTCPGDTVGSVRMEDNYRKPVDADNIFPRGGALYPTENPECVDDCDTVGASIRENEPYARGYYRYGCDDSGEEMKKRYNRFAGYITWNGQKENIKYCELGMSPWHAPGCDWSVISAE